MQHLGTCLERAILVPTTRNTRSAGGAPSFRHSHSPRLTIPQVSSARFSHQHVPLHYARTQQEDVQLIQRMVRDATACDHPHLLMQKHSYDKISAPYQIKYVPDHLRRPHFTLAELTARTPFPAGGGISAPCFACGSLEARKPSVRLHYPLNRSAHVQRSTLETIKTLSDPFQELHTARFTHARHVEARRPGDISYPV